jgi:iron(III) transport system permease protein
VGRGISSGQQSAIAALQQISPSIEEAATSLGADGTTTFTKISLPLIRPAIVTALTYAMTRSMTVMTAIIFIVTPQTQTMTSQLLNEVNGGRYGNAFAYCIILIAIVLVMMGLINAVVWLFTRKSQLRTLG